MGVISYDVEIPSSVPAEKMYKGFLLNSSDLLPKILPQAIKSIENLEGDGGVGTVKQVNFAQGSQFKTLKQRVDFVDKDNLTYSYSIIEGDALMNNLEAISYHFTVVPTDDGGCIVKNTSTYTTKGDTEIMEGQIKNGKERASHMFKAVEAYLLAN